VGRPTQKFQLLRQHLCRVDVHDCNKTQRATDVVEELEQVDVVLFSPEMFFEEEVDGTFEHERVVDGNVTDTGL
jgi:hypothetical protein